MSGTPPQLNHRMIRAGAGAGKTTGLVAEVVRVYEAYRGAGRWPRIVLTTFTRKATQEIRERLMRKACDERNLDLLRFVSDPGCLLISTIHGVLNTFLRQVGHLVEMDPGFKVLTEVEADQLARAAVRDVILAHPDNLAWIENYGFDRLTEMCRDFDRALREYGTVCPVTMDDLQAAAANHLSGWRDDVAALARHIHDQVDRPEWRKYADGLAAFAAGFDPARPSVEGLPRKPNRSAKQPELQPLHDRCEAVVKTMVNELREPWWDTAMWPRMVDEWRRFDEFGRGFAAAFARRKGARSAIEITDLELETLRLLRERPETATAFGEQWDYWMIDEYQDTSPVQVRCLESLIGERPRYYVGDPQQSIYLFRGADARVFERTAGQLRERGIAVEPKRRNYRSRPDLLAWINAFMADYGDRFEAMQPREDQATPAGRVCVELRRAEDRDLEVGAVVQRVCELLSSGARLEQISVLGRTHKTLMKVAQALRAKGYPTHVHSARGFQSRREVMDAQALWKFLINPHDDLNLLVLLRSPWFFVEDARLTQWMTARGESLWSSLEADTSAESLARLRDLRVVAGRDGVPRAFEAGLRDAGLLDAALIDDPAGRKESNLWKLVDQARELERSGGGSLFDFLAGGDADPLNSPDGDAASAQEPNCINLLTIHGAKGLEFEHVIVPGAGESPQLSSTAVFASANERYHFPIKTADEVKPVPSILDRLRMEERRAREVEEFDRWLYVAVTRAKSTLTLVWSEVVERSWASRGAMFRLPPGHHGTADFAFSVREEWPDAEAFTPHAAATGAIRGRFRDVAPAAVERRSVTSLLDGATPGESDGDPLARFKAQAFGQRLHRYFESMRYGHTAECPDEAAVEFVLGLTEPPMRELIHRGHAEWGFQVKTPVGTVEGQIDLWGVVDGRIYVVDYKSGSDRRVEQALNQLGLYAWALRRFGHQEPIRLAVVYPMKRKIRIEDFTAESLATREVEFSGA